MNKTIIEQNLNTWASFLKEQKENKKAISIKFFDKNFKMVLNEEFKGIFKDSINALKNKEISSDDFLKLMRKFKKEGLKYFNLYSNIYSLNQNGTYKLLKEV